MAVIRYVKPQGEKQVCVSGIPLQGKHKVNAMFYVKPEKFITSYHTFRFRGQRQSVNPHMYSVFIIAHLHIITLLHFHNSHMGQKGRPEIQCLLNGLLCRRMNGKLIAGVPLHINRSKETRQTEKREKSSGINPKDPFKPNNQSAFCLSVSGSSPSHVC